MEHIHDNPSTNHVSDGASHAVAGEHDHDTAHGAGSHKGKHDHAGHGGGGHGGGWLMTYCDMITLLMTFFICLLTFSANETGKNGMPRKRDSVLNGKGGSGILYERKSTLDRDSIVWRRLPALYHLHEPGSEIPPLYSDPALESTGEVLKLLEGAAPGTLADSYEMRITPMWFQNSPPRLTSTGLQILHGISGHLRDLPYSINIDVEDPAQLDKGLVIVDQLINTEGIAPARVAVGIRPRLVGSNANMWLVFKRNPQT